MAIWSANNLSLPDALRSGAHLRMCTVHNAVPELARLPRLRKSQIPHTLIETCRRDCGLIWTQRGGGTFSGKIIQERAKESGFVFFIVIVATEVAGLALGLLLLGAHVIERAAVEHNPDRLVPAQIGVLGEDRAHLLLEVLGRLDRALLH